MIKSLPYGRDIANQKMPPFGKANKHCFHYKSSFQNDNSAENPYSGDLCAIQTNTYYRIGRIPAMLLFVFIIAYFLDIVNRILKFFQFHFIFL